MLIEQAGHSSHISNASKFRRDTFRGHAMSAITATLLFFVAQDVRVNKQN